MPIYFDFFDETPIADILRETEMSCEEALHFIDAALPMGFWRSESDTGHVYFSDTMSDIYGMEPTSEPVNLSEVMNRIHPDDLPICLEMFEECAREHTPFDYTLRIADGAGGHKFIRSCGFYKQQPNGEYAMYGITHHVLPLEKATD